MRSCHILRPEPVFAPKDEIESESGGPIDHESERDGPKVGVIPAPTPTVWRSQHLWKRTVKEID